MSPEKSESGGDVELAFGEDRVSVEGPAPPDDSSKDARDHERAHQPIPLDRLGVWKELLPHSPA